METVAGSPVIVANDNSSIVSALSHLTGRVDQVLLNHENRHDTHDRNFDTMTDAIKDLTKSVTTHDVNITDMRADITELKARSNGTLNRVFQVLGAIAAFAAILISILKP